MRCLRQRSTLTIIGSKSGAQNLGTKRNTDRASGGGDHEKFPFYSGPPVYAGTGSPEQQSAHRHIAARSVRPFGRDHVARYQEHAFDIGLAAQPCQKIVERFVRSQFACGDMGERIEAQTAQYRRRLDIMAVVVAGQEHDSHRGAHGKIVTELLELVAVRGDFDGRRRQERNKLGD
jgi:hypothetical protein